MAILDAKSSKVTALGNTYLFGSTIKESVAKSALATFADGGDKYPMLSLTGYINPVQSGSGDPSPSNVRPITGWTGMNVTRTGKNLLDTEAMVAGILNNSGVVDVQNVSIGEKTKTSITWTSSSTWRGVTSDYIPVTGGEHYYLSLTETVSYVIYAWYDASKTFISRASYNGSSMQSVTAPNNAAFVRYTMQQSTAGTFTYHNIQLERGSSATAYEPYNGTTYPISWSDEAGTVYGGTLDVTTGLLTVTHKMVSNITVGNKSAQSTDSVSIFSVNGTRPADGVKASTTDAVAPPYYCNRFKTNSVNVGVLGNKETGISASKSSNITYLTVPVSIASTKEEMNTWLSSNQTDIVAELETPLTYQLTPTEVLSVLGTNNVWVDTNGDVECTYIADTKLYIDSKL